MLSSPFLIFLAIATQLEMKTKGLSDVYAGEVEQKNTRTRGKSWEQLTDREWAEPCHQQRIAFHESVHTGQLLDYLRTSGIPRADIWD